MPLPPTGVTSVLVRDPVRISFAVYGFVQAVISVLLLASVIVRGRGGIITGVALALYGLVTQLFVSPPRPFLVSHWRNWLPLQRTHAP